MATYALRVGVVKYVNEKSLLLLLCILFLILICRGRAMLDIGTSHTNRRALVFEVTFLSKEVSLSYSLFDRL